MTELKPLPKVAEKITVYEDDSSTINDWIFLSLSSTKRDSRVISLSSSSSFKGKIIQGVIISVCLLGSQ